MHGISYNLCLAIDLAVIQYHKRLDNLFLFNNKHMHPVWEPYTCTTVTLTFLSTRKMTGKLNSHSC